MNIQRREVGLLFLYQLRMCRRYLRQAPISPGKWTQNLQRNFQQEQKGRLQTHARSLGSTARVCHLCNISSQTMASSSRKASSLESRAAAESERREWIFSSDFKPDIDLDHLSQNAEAVAEAVSHRKGSVEVGEVLEKMRNFQQLQKAVYDLEEKMRCCIEKQQDVNDLKSSLERLSKELEEAESDFYQLAVALPNSTHPQVPTAEDALPVLIDEVHEKKTFAFPIKSHLELGEDLDIIRIKNLGHITGHRSYFLKGAGAMLEDALVRFTLDRLVRRHGFNILRVPDIIRPVVFEGCGMRTKGLHTQVYKLSPQHHSTDYCLAGTGEVGIAGFFMNKTLSEEDLPLRMAAMSRCYRAETAHSAEARGLYRVHQFTKVEMFCITANETGEEGEEIFHEFVGIQRDMFRDLGLHFQILDMPAHDLGAPAYRKFDMEAWMPHRKTYGEISSTSNCTDFQSRRLNVKYRPNCGGEAKYVHTLNGTACAVPRMIISILENNQERDGSISIPDALQPFMGGMKTIVRPASGRLHFTRL